MSTAKKQIIEHLSRDYTSAVRDPLWKHIYLSQPMRKLINQKEFQKLARIKQLGPAVLVYPGAAHSRLNHSLGVFFLARQIIETLLRFDSCPELSLEGVKAFLCAALFHDLGHFPHAHSFKELPLKDHEILSGEIILNSSLATIIKDDVKTDPFLTAAIIDKKMTIDPEREDELTFFRNLLSGVLDPDKLDYLNRDAYFCGVPYGVQDTDFVLYQIIPTSNGLALPDKGVSAIENILFSKYLMYKTVYWHRDVRIATSLVKKAVYLGLEKEIILPDELYGMDDDTFYAKMMELKGEVPELIEKSEYPRLYRVILEERFDPANQNHHIMGTLEGRIRKEDELSDLMKKMTGYPHSPDSFLIDVPSKISFEVELPIEKNGELISFTHSGGVFSRPVVEGFTNTLRQIRYIVPEGIAARLRPEDLIAIRQMLHN